MDIQILQIGKSVVLVFIALILSITGTVSGQNNNNNGNGNNNNGNGLWEAAEPDTVFTNRHVKINNTVDVHGKLTVDSMRIRGALHIGDSSLTLIDDVTDINTGVKSDHIRSTQGRIALFGDNGAGGFNTNIRLGIGVHNPVKPLDIGGAGGIRINQTGNATFNNELYFQDNGQIRSSDNNHRIIFDRTGNIMELREYGDLVFSPGATAGNRTQTVTMKSGGRVGIGTTAPVSLFHIEAFAANTGLLFRTVGKRNVENKWQLYTGASAASATEKFKISVAAGSSNLVTLQSTQDGMSFNTGGAFVRTSISDFALCL